MLEVGILGWTVVVEGLDGGVLAELCGILDSWRIPCVAGKSGCFPRSTGKGRAHFCGQGAGRYKWVTLEGLGWSDIHPVMSLVESRPAKGPSNGLCFTSRGPLFYFIFFAGLEMLERVRSQPLTNSDLVVSISVPLYTGDPSLAPRISGTICLSVPQPSPQQVMGCSGFRLRVHPMHN